MAPMLELSLLPAMPKALFRARQLWVMSGRSNCSNLVGKGPMFNSRPQPGWPFHLYYFPPHLKDSLIDQAKVNLTTRRSVRPRARSPTYEHTRAQTRAQTTHFAKDILLPVFDAAAHLLPPALTTLLTASYLTTLPASCIYFKMGCENWVAPGIRCATELHILWFKPSFWHYAWRTFGLCRGAEHQLLKLIQAAGAQIL